MIAAIQEDRADQIDRAHAAETTADYFLSCLVRVGAGVDLIRALRIAEDENERLRHEVSELSAALDAARTGVWLEHRPFAFRERAAKAGQP